LSFAFYAIALEDVRSVARRFNAEIMTQNKINFISRPNMENGYKANIKNA
jgi:hypothetical protein